MERLLKPAEVARHFGVSAKTVYRWVKIGFIPSVVLRQPGGQRPVVRFRPSDIREFEEMQHQMVLSVEGTGRQV